MSQVDICKVLKDKLFSGDNRYFTVAEIIKILIQYKSLGRIESSHHFSTVNDDCKRLALWGVLERRTIDKKICYKYKKSRLDDINL